MFKTRSYKKELMDDLELSSQDLKKNLDELAFINYWLGGNQVITNALDRLLKRGHIDSQQGLKIADLGSGGGDLLRLMAQWGRRKKIPLHLVGIDANAFMIDYAQERSEKYPEISYEQRDVFSADFQAQDYDLVTCSLFCHHFTDEELIILFQKLHQEVKQAIIINDLHRHALAYYGIYFLTRLFRGSYLVKHDGPLSVLRAFKYPEIQQLLQASQIERSEIRWLWAFRYQVICFGENYKK